ncbi:MAG: energy-coupling factor transporter ATPase [Clostridia bacterium]|nr:energy-coupling factor transporter ATPase [Clostridia bacterium]
MSILIKAEHLTYSYPVEVDDTAGAQAAPAKKAVDDVSFEIEEGSFVAVLGHNGSGKSTLAKLLNMILPCDSGTITIDGKEITAGELSEEEVYDVRKKIGMVFQNPDNQIVATVVEEDVAFGPENLSLPSETIRQRVDEALATVGMTKYARHAPHKLSGGQKQRVAIAGIIAMRPKCIIFDESTAMLDPHGRREVMNTIERLNREEGITVIMITHYMDEATRADRVIVMNRGKIYMDGSPSEIFCRAEELWHAGLEVPQATEFVYRLKELGLPVPVGVYTPEECAKVVKKALEERKKGSV